MATIFDLRLPITVYNIRIRVIHAVVGPPEHNGSLWSCILSPDMTAIDKLIIANESLVLLYL